MSTVAQAQRWLLVKRLTRLLLVAALLTLVVQYPRIGAVLDDLTPPRLPDVAATARMDEVRLEQNWPLEISQQFHSTSQGTRTIPIPLSWLLALEAPHRSIMGVPFLRADRFMSDDYILRFGFIRGHKDSRNPHGLPVGFATTPSQNLPGVTYSTDAVGFSCAACHTGQLTYDGKKYIVDGGPASTDLGQMVKAIGAALGQTAIAGKLPFFNGRFERFARAVLQDGYSNQRKVDLKKELDTVVAILLAQQKDVDVVEGFGRLDALNRIGNQVFAINARRPENFAAINAPVNYPHLWTAAWFDWVQYDGSIMAPLIRNSGEAIGVNADLSLTAPVGGGRFSSSVPLPNLAWIEAVLAGPAPYPAKSFQGLLAPRWPSDAFPTIDMTKAQEGRALYSTHCQGCHLPPLDSEAIWGEFAQFDYRDQAGAARRTTDALLKVRTIPLSTIGTDPGQANILLLRTVDTAGNATGRRETHTPGMGLDATVCASEMPPQPSPLPGLPTPPAGEGSAAAPVAWQTVPVTDSHNLSFAKALAGLVQEVNDAWFAQNDESDALRLRYQEDRPNCIRAGAGYKARPLNGVWATAPFLHNGSVPTVYDLLSPVAERPAVVQLGSTEFDPVRLGLAQDATLVRRAKWRRNEKYLDGYFMLDTRLAGNHNTGHEFSAGWKAGRPHSQQPTGVIGPALSEKQRLSLVEFLKTQ